jgi:hypothetical protein
MTNQKTKLLFLLLFSTVAIAQKPTDVPKPTEQPIDLTNPADIIIYIILPLCVIMLVFIWRRSKNSKNK